MYAHNFYDILITTRSACKLVPAFLELRQVVFCERVQIDPFRIQHPQLALCLFLLASNTLHLITNIRAVVIKLIKKYGKWIVVWWSVGLESTTILLGEQRVDTLLKVTRVKLNLGF